MLYHGKLAGAPSLTAESLLRAELANGSQDHRPAWRR